METLTCGTGTDGHHHKLVQTCKVDMSDLSVIDRLSDDVDSAVVSNILTLQGYAKWGGLCKYGRSLHIRFYIFFSFFVSLKLLSKYKTIIKQELHMYTQHIHCEFKHSP